MVKSIIEFSALEVNEIFEKDRKESIIQKINECFGQPCVFDDKSENTSASSHTEWMSEQKHVWEVNDFEIFLKDLEDEQRRLDSKNFGQSFKNKIRHVYLVGLECKELPYFQLMIYAQLLLDTDTTVVADTARLAVPFQLYLQNLNGLSNAVYNTSANPRFHMHHVVNSIDDLKNGTDTLHELLAIQQNDIQHEILPTKQSKKIRELPVLREFGLPRILSAINYYGNVLSFVTHYEQFGGGRELQTCGVTIIRDHQNSSYISRPDKQQIAKAIQMFDPTLDLFFSTTHAINLHLFVTGLLTWLSYFEITRNDLSEKLELQRKQIQNMLNENNMSKITDFQDKIAVLQGNYASMGLLWSHVKNQVSNQIEELTSRKNKLGMPQIPIPQKYQNIFTGIFTDRIGRQVYFELVANRIKNRFATTTEKLDSTDNPINRMTGFLYNSSSLKLQKAIKINSKINIGLAILIGSLAVISVRDFFGF